MGIVHVDGSPSHTHGLGLKLIDWTWTEGARVVGSGETTDLSLPVGDHWVTLTVEDDGGNVHAEGTWIHVKDFGHPVVTSIEPTSGDIAGGELVTITGFGFDETNSVVRFGLTELTGDAVSVTGPNTIQVKAPAEVVGAPVPISVITPMGESNDGVKYTYIAGEPIQFESGRLTGIDGPTACAFGPGTKMWEVWRFVLVLFSLHPTNESRFPVYKQTAAYTWGLSTAVWQRFLSTPPSPPLLL